MASLKIRAANRTVATISKFKRREATTAGV
jgi:hypothetical protein